VKRSIYLDNHATTPVDPAVFAAMKPALTCAFGNAASRTHAFGWQAHDAVEAARAEVAALIGASAREIVFTSGATEANNLALIGAFEAARSRRDHVVTLATEHSSVLDCLPEIQRRGGRVTVLGVGPDGLADLDAVAAALTDRTVLLSVMAAHNEFGVLQPLEALGSLCRDRGVHFHTDAAQAAGKIPLRVAELPVDLVSLSAHKMYGPKGAGALWVRHRPRRVRLHPTSFGGGQEQGLRSGTVDVAGAVGFGAAAAICQAVGARESERLAGLRDKLLVGLTLRVPGLVVHGSLAARLPNNLHVSVPGVEGEALLMSVGELALSSGSACSSASREPSRALLALGVDPALARSSLRFGLGRFTTEADIDRAVEVVAEHAARLRAMNPAWAP
jgi:cysteine desulfurase